MNKHDIDRAGAIFFLLCTKNPPEEAATTSIEFLSAISMLQIHTDGETVFSLKSHSAHSKHLTVCGANALRPLSLILEHFGI
mgnify:CR=1 FL=1